MNQILFEQHPSPLLVYNLDTLAILRVNQAFIEKYHYREQEIKAGKLTIKDIHPEEDIPKLDKSLENLPDEGVNNTGIFRHQSKEGEIFYVKITSQRYPMEGINARIVSCIDISAQVHAEKRSAKAYEELRHHIENSPLASVKWDENFRIKEWSKQAERISGFEASEVIGKKIFELDFLNKAESSRLKEQIEMLVHGKRERNQFEMKVYRKDRRPIFIKIHSSALRDENGKLQSVLTLIEDITEQKKSEIKYQRLFENANDSIFIMEKGRFVDCNIQAEALFKASKEEIIGRTPYYYSPQTQPDGTPSETKAVAEIKRAMRNGSNIFEWQHEDAEGVLIDVEVSLNKIALPDGVYVQAIVRNITDKKLTLAKMRKSEELFRNLFLKSPAALVMTDVDDRVQVVNDSFEKIFGYDLEDIKGINLDDLVVPEEEREDAPTVYDRSFAKNDFQFEGVRLTKSGKQKYFLIAGMPVYINGKPVAGLGMYIDITDRKETEQRLKKSLEEKRVLLEEVHHRVKNNLAVVSGLLQMQTMHVDDERLTKYIQNSQLRIRSMAIVHEMLYQSSNLSEIKFDNYISKLVDVIADVLVNRVKDIDISVESDAFVLNVNQAIPCALIVSELITNAFEYAFKGREEGNVTIQVSDEGSKVSISIEDDGIGLPDNFEEKRKKSLGLSLIDNLCTQLETEIQIKSGDWGTRFHFTFERTNKPGSSSSNRML